MEGESSSRSDTLDSTPEWKYDVFLSFAGKDTRLKFVDHLDDAFKRSGIKTFKDDVDLERGGDIKQDLFQAIQDSRCAVVVISENYANSTWCLDELQKILESRSSLGLRVFPIFYDVDPADVRHQRKRFKEALAEDEDKFSENTTKVQNWRNVLCEIANLSGWDTRGRQEADLIKIIVGDVWTYLSSKLPSYDDNLVGFESRVADMISILEIGSDDKRSVGIWGMGGLGKTTLARVVCEKLSHKFEVCCFLDNVRETLLQREGLISLQKRLLSHLKIKDMKISDGNDGMKKIRKLLNNKKVLLVVDDIDDSSQLKYLAGSRDWFGKGSRIIITTRDSQVLTSSRVQRIYEMKTMRKDESLKLFSNKAFDKDCPELNYLELSESVVQYAGGLPLALEVLGSFLCGRSEDEWADALDRLKQIPDDGRILQTLKISYDGLMNEKEKTIFLDIACFFKGWSKREVAPILESCDLNPTIGIKILIQKTLLIETKDGRLEMHDLLEDLGRHIVRQESPNNVGKRSRLWKFEDIKEVLENNKGYEKIEAIVMEDYHWSSQGKIEVHPGAFSRMSNIRLFVLGGTWMRDNPLILPRELNVFGVSKLKVVRWPSFPSSALPLPLDGLVHIEMPNGNIKQLWNGKQSMDKLKFIDLSYSKNFAETPDFSRVPYLEHLRLYSCDHLVEVHYSLGKLEKLAKVDLAFCKNLEILPKKLETNSLTTLHLQGCSKVALLPEFGEGMKKLSYLNVSGTAITELSKSLGYTTGLEYLDLNQCELLKTHISRQINSFNITSLTALYLSGCNLNDGSISDNFGSLSSLIILDLSDNHFVSLPSDCFSSLSRLLFLALEHCKRLKSLPRLPPRLVGLYAFHCDSMEPLSENLIFSLDHEYRGRTKYVIRYEEYDNMSVEPVEYFPLRDFFAIITGREMPSWFPNKECWYEACRSEYVIKVNIPPHFRYSKWSGIVICLHSSDLYDGLTRSSEDPEDDDYDGLTRSSEDPEDDDYDGLITWSSKAPEDDNYICNEWKQYINFGYLGESLCIMVLELNEETCWQHLRGHNNSLHIKLSTFGEEGSLEIMKGCGWRVLCKEDIQEWCYHNDFNQPQLLASPHDDEINIPKRVIRDFYGGD